MPRVRGPDTCRPQGMRVRLRSTFDCSTLASEPARVICAAMKKYGLIFADNGSPWYVSGEATGRYVRYGTVERARFGLPCDWAL